MYYKDIEAANREARQKIKDLRAGVQHIPAVCRILKEFDGKVYNCRFDKAINAATEQKVYVSKDSYWLSIYAYPEHNYSYLITLAQIRVGDLTDGKRIPADKLIESIRQNRERLLRTAYELETVMEQMPQIRDYIEQSIEKINKFIKSIPDDARSIYGLPCSIRVN